jgi:hypothetical protein
MTWTAVAHWLKYCATNQKVAGSIPDVVIEFFIEINPSDRTMAPGSTQPLTEMKPGIFFGGKGALCLRLTTLSPSCAVFMKSVKRNFLEPSGTHQACNGSDLPFIF